MNALASWQFVNEIRLWAKYLLLAYYRSGVFNLG